MTPDQHRNEALRLARRSDHMVTYNLLCGGGPPGRPRGARATPRPTKLFDDFFYVGLGSVGAYVIRTSAGLILIDALHNEDEARDVIVPGIRSLGLDPAQIRYVVISHGHMDHYGGARYIAETYGARVVASAADWELMRGPRAPARDLVAVDGQDLTLGDFSMTLVHTPGHTPGTLSFIIPVSHLGTRHTLAMWGGTGLPRHPAVRRQYVASLERFEKLAREARVDVVLSNHPFVDGSLAKMNTLRADPAGPNPFVIGQDRYADFIGILKHCASATIVAGS